VAAFKNDDDSKSARRDPILQVAQPDLKLAQLVLIHFRRFNLCASVLPGVLLRLLFDFAVDAPDE
jgi:hypothetical protein